MLALPADVVQGVIGVVVAALGSQEYFALKSVVSFVVCFAFYLPSLRKAGI